MQDALMKFNKNLAKTVVLFIKKFITRDRLGFMKFEKIVHIGNESLVSIPTSSGKKIILSFTDHNFGFFDFSDKKVKITYNEGASRCANELPHISIELLKED